MSVKIYDVKKYWRPAQIGSLIACAIAVILLIYPGLNYGIDFAGGTNIIARFAGEPNDNDVRQALATLGFNDASVVRFGESGDETQFLIQTQAVSAITEEVRVALQAQVTSTFGEGAEVVYDEASGDRIYVRLSEATYDAQRAELIAQGFDVQEGVAGLSQLAAPLATKVAVAAEAAGFEGAQSAPYGNPNARRFQLDVHTLQHSVAEHFQLVFPDSFRAIDQVETVGPRVGQQLRADALQAILFALIGMLLYVAVRFDLRYAPGAVIALAHNVLITLGIFALLQEEISLSILAALLTIVGYSINDTIVIFDRVRENLAGTGGNVDLPEVMNRSISQSLNRTIMTSLTTLIAVVVIYILGSGLIRSFSLAMIIGITVGTYSSNFIATPLMVKFSDFLDAQAKAKAEKAAAAK